MALFNYTRDEITKSLRKAFGLRGDMGSRVETVLQPTYRVAQIDEPPFHWYRGFAGGAAAGPVAGQTSMVGVSNTAPFLLVVEAITVQAVAAATRFRLTSQGNGVLPSAFGPFPNHDGTWDVNDKDIAPLCQFGARTTAAMPGAGATLFEGELAAGATVVIPGKWNLDPGGAQFSPLGSADFGQTLWVYSVAVNVALRVSMWGKWYDPTDMGIGR